MKRIFYILTALLFWTNFVQSQIITGASYSISPRQISDSIKTKVSRDSITQNIRATGSTSANMVGSEYAIRELFNTLRISGRVIGSGNTYATIPTTSTETGPAINGDVAYLTTEDIGNGTALNPQYPKGLYVRQSNAWALALRLNGDITQLTNVQAIDNTSTVFGTVSGQLIAAAASQRTSYDSVAVLQDSIIAVYRKIGNGTYAELTRRTVRVPPVQGLYFGASTTYVGLPQNNGARAVMPGDWALLTQDVVGAGTPARPDFARGMYRWNSVAYELVFPATTSRAGVFVGSSTTYAGLPTTGPDGRAAITGDWTLLSTPDIGNGTPSNPQYPTGIYQWVGASYMIVSQLAPRLLPGGYFGASASYAALPRTTGLRTAIAGDWAFLTQDSIGNGTATLPEFPRGGYRYNGTTYDFAWNVPLDAEILRGAVAPTGVPTGKIYIDTVARSVYGALFGSWVQVGGSTTKWYQTTSNTTSWFKRWLVTGTLASLSFDFTDPANDAVVGNFTISDFSTGFSASGYYGGTARFIDVVMSNGTTARIVIAVYTDNAFLINVLNTAGTANGKISNINITLAGNPNTFRVDHGYISQVPFSSQVVTHTGTPAAPVDGTRSAIAVNTTNNQTSHYWNTATSTWTALAPRSRVLFWAANTALEANEPRWAVISGAIIFLHNRAARNSGATRTPAEYDQFDYIGQSTVPVWAANTVYPAGFRVEGTDWHEYQRINSGTSSGTFDDNERSSWRLVSSKSLVYHTGTPAEPINTISGAIALNTTTNQITHRWDVQTQLWVAIPTQQSNPEVVYHTGTPANPLTLTAPAIAINTSTNTVTHRWNTGTNAWVSLAFPTAVTALPTRQAIISTTSNYATPNSIVAAGGSRTGGIITLPSATRNFQLFDGDWDGEVRLAASATGTDILTIRNDATLNTTVSNVNTNMAASLNLASGQTAQFAPTVNGWAWVPYAVAPASATAKATASHTANAGTALNCGSIRLRMNTGANRTLQIQSNTGANLVYNTMSFWEGGSAPFRNGTANTTGWNDISDFNFTAIGNFQLAQIHDVTNGRRYLVTYRVENSFNNSPMMITEL